MSRLLDEACPWHQGIDCCHDLVTEGCELLVMWVYQEAVEDWRRNARALLKQPGFKSWVQTGKILEDFLRRGWCTLALNLDGDWVVERLYKEFGE